MSARQYKELCPQENYGLAVPGHISRVRKYRRDAMVLGTISRYQNTILEAAFLSFLASLHWQLNESLPTSYILFIAILVIWVGACERWDIS